MGEEIIVLEKIKGSKFRKDFPKYHELDKFFSNCPCGENYNPKEIFYKAKHFQLSKKQLDITVYAFNEKGDIVGNVQYTERMTLSRNDLETIRKLEESLK